MAKANKEANLEASLRLLRYVKLINIKMGRLFESWRILINRRARWRLACLNNAASHYVLVMAASITHIASRREA